MTIITPNFYDFDHGYLRVPGTSYLTFSVRACQDAHIALGRFAGETGALEVVLGVDGNQRSVILSTKQGREVASMDTPNILSCDQFRDFWVGWSEGDIRFGRALIFGRQFILGWKSEVPRFIRTIEVASGTDEAVEWKMFMQPGICVHILLLNIFTNCFYNHYNGNMIYVNQNKNEWFETVCIVEGIFHKQ